MLRLPSAALSRRRLPAPLAESCSESMDSTAEGSPACRFEGASPASSSRTGSRSPLSGWAAYDLDTQALGTGGSATVRVARPRAGGPRCVVKSLRKEDAASQRLAQNEASVLKSLEHSSICKLLDTFEDEDSFNLVLEYIEGHELFDEVAAQRPMGEQRAAEVMSGLLVALQHCHKQGIVHRDVKPENIMVATGSDDTSSPQVKLIDFGLALRNGQRFSGVAGTQAYLAPEAPTGASACGPALDMWSAGVVLYACLMGELPPSAVRSGLLPVRKAEAFARAKVSPAARDLVARLLSLEPADRLTAEEALQHAWLRGSVDCPAPEQQADAERGSAPSWRRSCAKVMHAERVRKFRERIEGLAQAAKEQILPSLSLVSESAPKEPFGHAAVVVEAALDVLDAVSAGREVAQEIVALIDAATSTTAPAPMGKDPRPTAIPFGSNLFGGCCGAEVIDSEVVIPDDGLLEVGHVLGDDVLCAGRLGSGGI